MLRLLLLALLLAAAADANKKKSHKDQRDKWRPTSECSSAEVRFGRCVPEAGDCGAGLRDLSCREETQKISCRVPCNWKKNIVDCKYRFGPWGPCDSASNAKSRSGTLKRALFHAECRDAVTVSKPCAPKAGRSREEKSK